MKIHKYVFVVGVVASIIAINVSSYQAEDILYSDVEYRNMASMPESTTETLLDGSFFKDYETYNLDQISVRSEIIDLNSKFQNLMKVKIRNGYVIIDNELLIPYSNYASVDTQLVSETSAMKKPILEAIQNASTGKHLLFIDIAEKPHIFQERLPFGMTGSDDFVYSKINRTFEDAQSLGILTLSADETLRAHLSDNIFYKSDHHYTLEGASYVYEFLLNYFNETFDGDFAPELWEDMAKETIDFPFSGSEGRAIGDVSFSQRDVHTVAYPSRIESYERYESGELSESPLLGTGNPSTYGAYMSGDKAHTVIKTNRPDLESILFIGDSFTNALEYLSINDFNEVHSLDPRHYTGSITEYIESVDVDYVVIVRDSLLKPEYFR